MHTILGAGGPISDELAKLLAADKTPFRLVGRNPSPRAGGHVFAADLSNRQQTIEAVAGSSVAYLLVGLKYDLKTWQETWPKLMANAIEACKRARAKLVFFDNVYMYGRVNGPMTESTPYAPCSKKGEIRARVATALMGEVEAGNLTGMIARAADFYGPDTKHGVPNVLVFEHFAKAERAMWLVNDKAPHSLTFTPDAARGIWMAVKRETAWNQVWHLPTAADALTGQQFIELAAGAFGVKPKYMVLKRPMLRAYGWFDPVVRESWEMLYQSEYPYVFDSSKFAKEFGFAGTPYAEGVQVAAESYKKGA